MSWDVKHSPQAVAVGNVVFVAGCTARDSIPQQIEDEVELALDTARRSLEAIGSELGNVVKTFFLLTDLADYGRVRKTETEFYERHAPQLVTTPPAATLMVVPSLSRPEVRVQYEAIAALDRAMPGWGVTYYPEYWGGKELAYPHVPKEHAKFARSQSIGNLLVVSGCQALDHDTVMVETSDFAEQSRIVLDKVGVALEESGGSVANLVKTNVFVKDAGSLATYREVERAFFEEHAPGFASDPPASAVYVVEELPRPEFLIEVEAFAVARTDHAWPVRRRAGSPDAAESASAGRLVFTSACTGLGHDGSVPAEIADEISQALDNLREVLARAESSMGRLVKLTLTLSDAGDYPTLENALQLVDASPVTTFLQAQDIVPAGARFQLDAVATV